MKRRIVNALGAIGYLFLLTQWMWLVATVVLPVAMQPGVRDLFLPNTEPRPERVVEARDPLPEPVMMVMFGAAILFAVGIIIYAIISVPRAVGRGGQRVTQSVARQAVPVITHHQKITKKRERTLTERITWTIKAIAIIIPLILLAIPPGEIIELDHTVAAVFGAVVGLGSIAAFSLQLLLAKVWRIDSRFVW